MDEVETRVPCRHSGNLTPKIDENMRRTMEKRGYQVETVNLLGPGGDDARDFYGYADQERGILMVFIDKMKKDKCTALVETGYRHLILVCSQHTQPNMTYLLANVDRVELIPMHMMRYFLFDHSTVPDYEVVPQEVAKTITAAHCTRIIESDAVCIVLGLRVGDVVIEHNTDCLKGPCQSYRRVFAV